MSLKSFDKFCEDLILKEPGSEKIIYDERQKVAQMKLGVETMIIFGVLAVLNCVIMDVAYQYAESYTMPIIIILLFGAFYFRFRCAAKDCLIGINGVGALRIQAYTSIFLGLIWAIRYVFDEKEEGFPIVDGKISDDVFSLSAFFLAVVYGITTLILINHIQRKKSKESE